MTPSRFTAARRVVALSGAATLVATVTTTALLSTASAAECAAWTDPKGDSTTGQRNLPGTADAQLDILASSFGTVGDSVVATVTTDDLSDSSSDAGDEFALRFTVAGQDIVFFVDRTAPLGEEVDVTAGFFNFTTDTDGGEATAKFDLKTKTVTLTGKVAELAKAAGKPVAGQAVTDLRALTSNQTAFGVLTPAGYDDAPTKLPVTIGTACQPSGGAAPAPGGGPAPAPTSSPTAAPAPTGAPPAGGALVLPRAGCQLFVDPKGDVKAGGNAALNEPALDITAVAMRTTGTDLVGYVKADKLALGPSTGTDGMRYSLGFTHNKNVFTMSGSSYKTPAAANVRATLAQTGQFGANTQLGVNVPPITDPNGRVTTGIVPSGLKVQFDLPSSYVVFTLPLADIEKYGKAPAAGATFSAVNAGSAMDTGALASGVDAATAAKPEEAVYQVGDNACFATPTVLTSIGARTAQFTDVAKVAVKLSDGAGNPLAGREVALALPGAKATVVTGNDGVARMAAVMRTPAGAGTLTATFAGAGSFDTSTLSVPFTVTVEKTVLRAKGGRGSVTATLLDDDRRAVAGQVVTFTQGKVKRSGRTSSKGLVKVGGFKPGAVVTVTYAGAKGKFTAARTSTRG